MIAPRKPKELLRLLMTDPELLQAFYDLVAQADQLIKQKSDKALRETLRRKDIDLRLMSHRDVSSALNLFYRKARLAGQFVRMW